MIDGPFEEGQLRRIVIAEDMINPTVCIEEDAIALFMWLLRYPKSGPVSQLVDYPAVFTAPAPCPWMDFIRIWGL